MTLVLKSDNVSSRAIGDIHGTKGPIDWSLMLDFANQLYVRRLGGQGLSLGFFDAVNFSRTSPAWLDGEGGLREYAANVPRFDRLGGNRGIVIEPQRNNFYRESLVILPSKTFNIAATTQFVVVSIEGTGSVEISGDIVNLSGPASAGAPATFQLANPTQVTPITVSVSGSVSWIQVETASGGVYASSKMPSSSAALNGIRTAESLEVLPSLLEGLFSSGGTVVVNHSLPAKARDLGVNQMGQAGSLGIWGLVDANSNMLALSHEYNYNQSQFRFKSGAVDKLSNNNTARLTSTSAIAFGNGLAQSALNGVVNDQTNVPGFTPTRLALSSVPGWRPYPHGGITSRVAVYSRQLTHEELSQVTQSWL